MCYFIYHSMHLDISMAILNCCFQELECDTRNITRNIESKSQIECLPELQRVNTKSILKVTFISASIYYKLNLGSLVVPQNLG